MFSEVIYKGQVFSIATCVGQPRTEVTVCD